MRSPGRGQGWRDDGWREAVVVGKDVLNDDEYTCTFGSYAIQRETDSETTSPGYTWDALTGRQMRVAEISPTGREEGDNLDITSASRPLNDPLPGLKAGHLRRPVERKHELRKPPEGFGVGKAFPPPAPPIEQPSVVEGERGTRNRCALHVAALVNPLNPRFSLLEILQQYAVATRGATLSMGQHAEAWNSAGGMWLSARITAVHAGPDSPERPRSPTRFSHVCALLSGVRP